MLQTIYWLLLPILLLAILKKWNWFNRGFVTICILFAISTLFSQINAITMLIYEVFTLFFFIPAILYMLPTETVRAYTWNYRLQKILKILTFPPVSMALLFAPILVSHHPNVITAVWNGSFLNFLFFLYLCAAAAVMWLPMLHNINVRKKMHPMVKVILLLFSGILYFQTYGPIFSHPELGHYYIGGLASFIIQELLMIVYIAVIFITVGKKEQKVDKIDYAKIYQMNKI